MVIQLEVRKSKDKVSEFHFKTTKDKNNLGYFTTVHLGCLTKPFYVFEGTLGCSWWSDSGHLVVLRSSGKVRFQVRICLIQLLAYSSP